MKCPKCGSERVKYDVSRKANWSGHKGFKQPEPRKDFNATCKNCGWKGIIQ
jgi:predicted RNA-binding Zn-ribbon protein involved in translation (DUF1610 family)